MSIIVFGSINMDLIVNCQRLPLPGETLLGGVFLVAPGGKGANQAVAASRLGARTHLVGCVGADDFGVSLLDSLVSDGIDISNVRTIHNEATGVALITVEESGENTIVVASGANLAVGQQDVDSLIPLLHAAKVLLLQLEVPVPAVLGAAKRAHASGVTVILDPAPAVDLPRELYGFVDIITPNEGEAERLVGFPLRTNADIMRAAHSLRERGTRNVIVKLGGKGVYLLNEEQGIFKQPYAVTPLDTTAAGDAFNGGMAAALAEGRSLDEALKWALASGALAVTKHGAQPSLPNRYELFTLLATRP